MEQQMEENTEQMADRLGIAEIASQMQHTYHQWSQDAEQYLAKLTGASDDKQNKGRGLPTPKFKFTVVSWETHMPQ